MATNQIVAWDDPLPNAVPQAVQTSFTSLKKWINAKLRAWVDAIQTTVDGHTTSLATNATDITSLQASRTSYEAAWTSYTPAVLNATRAAVTKTVTYAKYNKIGKTCRVNVRLDITSNSAGAGQIQVELPFPSAQNAVSIGQMAVFDTFGNIAYTGIAFALSGSPSYAYFMRDNTAAAATQSFTLITNDWVMLSVTYETT